DGTPVDPNGPPTLWAGIGRFSSAIGQGGPREGLLVTTDGGAHWSVRGQSTFADVTSVVPTALTTATGQAVLAAASDLRAVDHQMLGTGQEVPTDPTTGLFRSEDGGATWQRISGAGHGLPAGYVTDLVADPADPNPFYAALIGVGVDSGVYRS